MRLSIETVTPTTAKKWLETNLESQRGVSPRHVERLTQMMHAGEFDGMNGETIKFNGKKGSEKVIDGQHRLWAIVKSGRKQQMAVLRGCSSEAFRTVDNSAHPRTVENYFQIANQSHAKLASQVAKWLYNYEGRKGQIVFTPNKTPGHIAQWAMENHPDIPEVVGSVATFCSQFQKAGLGTKAHLAFAHYLWHGQDSVYAFEVARYMGTNVGEVSTTIASTKQWLINDRPKEGQSMPGNVRIMRVLAALLSGWNADRAKSKHLKIRGITERVKQIIPKETGVRPDALRLPPVC